tara:strand:- start:884 stop:1198 length:315 start_codon:yes stop_codon:yes gene_type:complete
MIICYTDNTRSINLRWRDAENERQEKIVTDFRPYFFIKQTDKRPETYKAKEFINGKNRSIPWPFLYEEGDWVNLEGRQLTKVIVGKPLTLHRQESYGSKHTKQM